jgi:hypothetical protein
MNFELVFHRRVETGRWNSVNIGLQIAFCEVSSWVSTVANSQNMLNFV